jgi:hypothetical protein
MVFMKYFNRIRLWPALIVGVFYLAGCASGMNQATIESIDKARSIALSESTSLDDESKKMISENVPRHGFYRLAGEFTQHYFIWRISSHRTLTVYGEGDAKTLEGHKVVVKSTNG